MKMLKITFSETDIRRWEADRLKGINGDQQAGRSSAILEHSDAVAAGEGRGVRVC